jgi:hypothetical protein
MNLDHEAVDSQIATLLRDKPSGTTADLADFAAAYLDGDRVRYVFAHEDGHGALDDEFELDEYAIESWNTDLAAWFENPRFTEKHPQVLAWLKAGPGK